MKLLKITTYYNDYVTHYYKAHPFSRFLSYTKQKNAMDHDAFAWGDAWGDALSALGYEVEEIIANIKPLQMAWLKENSRIAGNSLKNWVLEIPIEQIKRFKPDVLFMDDYATFSAQWIAQVRRECPSIKLVIGWCGADIEDLSVLKAYDEVLSCSRDLVEKFQAQGFKSRLMHNAFDPRIIERIKINNRKNIGISFVGQFQNPGHSMRKKILETLAEKIDIKIYSPEFRKGQKTSLSKKIFPPVFGLGMYQVLHDSKLTFNCHIDLAVKHAANMRMYEATGVGTCLITDWKENIRELFVPEKEIVTYKTAGECLEKVKWLLNDPKERLSIGLDGQARTLKDHTFRNRAEILAAEIGKYFKQK